LRHRQRRPAPSRGGTLARAGGVDERPGNRPLPGGAASRGERLSPGAGEKRGRRGVLCLAREQGRLRQRAGGDQLAVELAHRDPGELIVELALREVGGRGRVIDEYRVGVSPAVEVLRFIG